MPVPPSSSSVGRYSTYTSSYGSYRPASTASYLGRTTSLDRANNSSYGGYSTNYGTSSYSRSYSTSASKYPSASSSRPPLPNYSSSEPYRSSRSTRVSPVRSTYSRLSSADSYLDSSTSRFSSRLKDRDSVERAVKDSGYSSRISSRDRSLDLSNGNGLDSSHFGPTVSSYASSYSWDKSDDKADDENAEAEKVKISERIRAFESGVAGGRERDRESSSIERAKESTYGSRSSLRDSSYSKKDRESNSSNNNSYSRPSIYDKDSNHASTVRDGSYYRRRFNINETSDELRDSIRESTRENSSENASSERRLSVSELTKKYDVNHNVNGETDDDDIGEVAATKASGESSTSRRRTDSTRSDRQESPSRKGSTKASKGRNLESPPKSRLDISPSRGKSEASPLRSTKDKSKRDSPARTHTTAAVVGGDSREGRASPMYNGTTEKRSALDTSQVDEGYGSGSSANGTLARSRYRRDRIKERVAARLAKELEDEYGSSSSVSTSSSTGSGVFSENNGLVGLRNIGNTCFMNSVIQCLSNTRYLMEFLVKDSYQTDINTSISTMKGDLVRGFAHLLREMWLEGGDNSRALNTGPFKAQIQRFAPAFTGYQQHDAQEFLRKLLEGLSEDVNRVTAKPKPILEDIPDHLDDNQKAMESWKRYLRYDDSKIVDTFVGQLKSALTCSVCGYSSVTFDPFWDLSLPIPSKTGQVRLSQCLDLFTKEETLDGDERPTCSKCKERRKMTKSFSIQKFPKVLVLHFKRFSPLERWRGKLSCTVEFPMEGLDLSAYAAKSSNGQCVYHCQGVANHSGTTYSGHYTAYCKHPYTGAWHEYNDSRVSSISPSRVCSPEAYVVFYELSSASPKL
ncbi:unnamed protein product [Meganyctiphanes norvegica]|uniref:ubiquitinyl hydrolase 1 n=1 Tax=Meganyctiphanes norvegica TaxID=48144 RepID=A0AAV2PLI3_MEGNR